MIVSLKLGGVIIERANVCISYLGVKFIIKCKMLVIDVNTNDLSEQVRCELIVKKCSPILIYGLDCGHNYVV